MPRRVDATNGNNNETAAPNANTATSVVIDLQDGGINMQAAPPPATPGQPTTAANESTDAQSTGNAMPDAARTNGMKREFWFCFCRKKPRRTL